MLLATQQPIIVQALIKTEHFVKGNKRLAKYVVTLGDKMKVALSIVPFLKYSTSVSSCRKGIPVQTTRGNGDHDMFASVALFETLFSDGGYLGTKIRKHTKLNFVNKTKDERGRPLYNGNVNNRIILFVNLLIICFAMTFLLFKGTHTMTTPFFPEIS